MNERNFHEHDSYRNGSTRPPKSHGGIIAVLLVAVIFLGGIVSALSILNIRLTQHLSQDPDSPVVFHDAQDSSVETDESTWPALGLSGEDVPDVYQRYYQLPAGVCITAVADHSVADLAGISAGDILMALDCTTITDTQDFDALLAGCQPQQTIQLLLYRDQSQLTLYITLP